MAEGEPKASGGVCATHGLRYDPASTTGCVICRREAAHDAAAPPAGATPAAGGPGSLLAKLTDLARARPIVTVGGIGVVVLVLGIAGARVAFSSPASGAASGPSATAGSAGKLATYLDVVDAFDRALPLD